MQPSKRRKNDIQKAHVPSVKPKEATPQRHLDVIAIPNVEILQQSFLRYQGEKEEAHVPSNVEVLQRSFLPYEGEKEEGKSAASNERQETPSQHPVDVQVYAPTTKRKVYGCVGRRMKKSFFGKRVDEIFACALPKCTSPIAPDFNWQFPNQEMKSQHLAIPKINCQTMRAH